VNRLVILSDIANGELMRLWLVDAGGVYKMLLDGNGETYPSVPNPSDVPVGGGGSSQAPVVYPTNELRASDFTVVNGAGVDISDAGGCVLAVSAQKAQGDQFFGLVRPGEPRGTFGYSYLFANRDCALHGVMLRNATSMRAVLMPATWSTLTNPVLADISPFQVLANIPWNYQARSISPIYWRVEYDGSVVRVSFSNDGWAFRELTTTAFNLTEVGLAFNMYQSDVNAVRLIYWQ